MKVSHREWEIRPPVARPSFQTARHTAFLVQLKKLSARPDANPCRQDASSASEEAPRQGDGFPPGPGKGAASPEFLSTLDSPIVLDVRDPNEVEAGKGGPPACVPGSVNVPLNMDGRNQKEHLTTEAEFLHKLHEAGFSLPEDKSAPIITHCGSGGRGSKAAAILRGLGYTNTHNGGSPANIAAAKPRANRASTTPAPTT